MRLTPIQILIHIILIAILRAEEFTARGVLELDALRLDGSDLLADVVVAAEFLFLTGI
jgi:hypothetical protein